MLAAMLTFSFAFAATANAKMVKKVDNFILFLDQSGSMAMRNADGVKKIEKAKSDMLALNAAIPSLDYNSAVALFAPFEVQCAPKPYSDATVASAINAIDTDYQIFNRRTPMGAGLDDINPVVGKMSGKTALLIFTDGESNYGADPVAVAKNLYAKYGANLCVHVVSYADTPEGTALNSYAKDVFYEDVAEPAPAPAPVVAPAPANEVVSFNLNFGFDKYQITDEMIPVLEQAKMILEEDTSATYEISGHTDATGTEAYNQGLSERRANSVMKWLTDNGIGADRLEAKGYGELAPKYDNSTKEGRKLNRRVEIQTK
jgi:OOP family OmpA-OmpF porin